MANERATVGWRDQKVSIGVAKASARVEAFERPNTCGLKYLGHAARVAFKRLRSHR